SRHSGIDPRQDVLSARVGTRRRQRIGPHHRADLRRRAQRHDRMGERAGADDVHDPAAARNDARGRQGKLAREKGRREPMYAYDYEPPRGDGNKAVWIVDDDRSIRWVLEKALAREGIPYKTFATAYEVLQALTVSEPQVLVSDIRMPGESGL